MAHSYDNNKVTLGRGRNSEGRDMDIVIPSGSTLLVLAITVDGLTARTGGAPRITAGGTGTFTQRDQNRYYASTGETISELWDLVAPTAGQLTIHIPDDNNKYFSADAASFSAASPKTSAYRTATGASGSSADPTCGNLTGLATGDVLVATSGDGAATYAPSGRTGTSLYEVDDGAYGHATQYYVTPNANDVNMSWTFSTSSTWGAVVAAYKEVLPTITGTVAGSLTSQVTASVAGAPKITGTIAPTLTQVTATVAGKPKITGTVAGALTAQVTSSVSGKPLVSGTVAGSLTSQVTASLTGQPIVGGTVAASLTKLTASCAGSPLVTGSVGATLTQIVSSINGTSLITGNIAATLTQIISSINGYAGTSGPSWVYIKNWYKL